MPAQAGAVGGNLMGDKSPKNNAKSKKQKNDKQKAVSTAKAAAIEAAKPAPTAKR